MIEASSLALIYSLFQVYQVDGDDVGLSMARQQINTRLIGSINSSNQTLRAQPRDKFSSPRRRARRLAISNCDESLHDTGATAHREDELFLNINAKTALYFGEFRKYFQGSASL